MKKQNKNELELTKNELASLEAYGYNPKVIRKPNEDIIDHIIVISHGRQKMHEAGYPFIKIFGVTEKKELINLGWHDHFVSYTLTNTDSLGKNVFRVGHWNQKKKWRVRKNFISLSSFMIGNTSGEENDEYTYLS